MRIIFVVLLFYLIDVALSQQKKGFLVTAPNTLLTDTLENVCVSLHNNIGPVQVSVTLWGTYTSQVLSTSSLSVKSASCLELYVPKTEEVLGRLVVRLQSTEEPDLSGNSEKNVQLQGDPLVVLVSTDKPLYKPGQEVCFRILSLTHRLKPYNEKVHKIWIETPTGIRVQQWNEVEVTKHGLVQLQFPLDNESFLGQWRIKVQHNSSKVEEKGFWVKEYVPTKFEVTVHNPNEILPDSKNVSWHICAKYSYGEVVQGEAHIEIKLQGSQVADQPSINHAVKLNRYTGCVDVAVDSSVLGLSDPLVQPTGVHLVATVTEQNTGVSYSTSVVSPVHNQAFVLQFQCSHYFKPGLPYKGNVVMRTMDGKQRSQVGEKIQVCIKVRYLEQVAMKLLQCWNYTTDFSSHVVFALPDISDPFNIQIITLTATAVDHPTKFYPGSMGVMLLQPSVVQHVKPWFSPSHSYVDVFTRTTLACATSQLIPVYYSVPSANTSTPLFYYLIESRGDLLLLNSVTPKDESIVHTNEVSSGEVSLVRSWRLPIQVTHEMAPQSRLTVYYVRSDGEVVATSTNLVVDRCFHNKVRVRWDEPQVSPREEAHLCIRASPYSVCGVSVTDRQLDFNASDINRHSQNVWDVLNKFTLHISPRDQRVYCINKNQEEEKSPPTYDLRKRRSLSMFRPEYSDYVDSITAFDDLGVTVMSNLVLETRPCIRPIYPDELSFRRSWTFSRNGIDFQPPIADNLMVVAQQQPTTRMIDNSVQSLVRDYFPDTWIWSLVYTGRGGEVIVNSTAPDTITSWDTKVVCISERDGLGVAESKALSVFMPFFVHVETPYSVKRGENVTIKVVVYNYLHHPIPILLRIPDNEKLAISPGQDIKFCLKELSPHSSVVSITAKTAGMVNLTAIARIEPLVSCGPPEIPIKSDTIIKQLLVKNDGCMQQKSHSAFICPTEDSDPSVTWDLQLPDKDNLVQGSERLQFTVVADMFGPALKNLDSLVLMPMGCGEQNLARLAPNLYVLKYMEAMGFVDKQLKATALKNIQKGYQRQLLFLRSDGSFSAFGERDETGSIWLTAAVVKTFSEAKRIIDVNQDTIHSSVVWITRQQLENGCFPTVGQVFHRSSEREEAEESTTSLSALIVTNLAGLGVVLPPSFKSNAELCLAAGIDSTEPYTLALTTLAFTRLGQRQRALEALTNLLRLAIVQNDVIHWGKPDTSVSHNIVMTSYAVLSLVELGGPENLITAQKAVRWISTHRNENGGFISTQDTVVALEALTAYMTALPLVNRTELVVLLTGDQLAKTFRLSDDNKLVQQQLITTKVPRSLNVAVVGEGCAFVQSVLKYNVKRPEEGSQLELRVSSAPVSTVDPCSMQELRLCAVATRPSQVTNMALLTVMMVTGFSPDRAQLQKISHPHIKKWEEEDDQIAFYLSEVNNLPICVTLNLVRKFEVEDPLPAVITLLDYYHPEISTSESYTLQCSPVDPLDSPMLADSPITDDNRFENFHNVNFELETPSGVEGPKPVYACPPNSTMTNCNS